MLETLPLGLTWVGFWLHFMGERQAARRTGRPRSALAKRRALAFYAGIVTVVLSVATPIHTLASELLWVHMIEHVMLLVIAAPLIAYGAPWMSLWRPLPLGLRRAVAGTWVRSAWLKPLRAGLARASTPVGAGVLFTASLVIWHLPGVYDLALRNEFAHVAEHFCFLGFGVLLWTQVISSPPLRCSLSYPGRIVLLVAVMIPNIAISMVMAFSMLADLPLLCRPRPPAGRRHGTGRPADRGGNHVERGRSPLRRRHRDPRGEVAHRAGRGKAGCERHARSLSAAGVAPGSCGARRGSRFRLDSSGAIEIL